MNKKVIKTFEEVTQYITKDTPKWALDTETTSLSYCDLELVGVSLCDGKNAYYVDLWENPDFSKIIEYLQRILCGSNLKLVFHNAPFDLKVLHKYGIKHTEAIFDTMVAAHLVNENIKKSLKYLAEKYLKVKTIPYEKAISDGAHSQKFYDYAMNDAIWTWQLHKIFERTLRQQKLDKLFFEIEMPFQFVLRDMVIDGVLVDTKKVEKLTKQVKSDLNEMTKNLCELSGIGYITQKQMFEEDEIIPEVNFGSSKQLINLIENKLKFKITETTDKGNKSVGKKTLKRLKDKHGFFKELERFKIATKLYNSFLIPTPDFLDSDNRLRAGFMDAGTRTGRLASSDPNMQQLPRLRESYPVDYRGIIIAPPGKSLIVADYSGQELRVLADISKDKNLIEAFQNDTDLHLKTANKIFGLGIAGTDLMRTSPCYANLCVKFKEKRHIGKNGVNFPIVYGTTPYGISNTFNIAESKAEEWINAFFELYPDVRKAIKKCEGFLKNYKYVYTKLLRRRRLYEWSGHSRRQAFNMLIQGYCADILRIACNNLRKLIVAKPDWKLKILLLVHDEIVFECKDEYVEIAKKGIKKTMESAVKLAVPLIVDIGSAKIYSEAK